MIANSEGRIIGFPVKKPENGKHSLGRAAHFRDMDREWEIEPGSDPRALWTKLERAFAARDPQSPWRRGTELLGSRYAIIGGAMTWVSDCRLVSAISNAGAFGVLAGGALTAEELDREIIATRAATERPFGVNLIRLSPHYKAQLECCFDQRVGVLIIGGGILDGAEFARAKHAGAKLLAFAPSLAAAKHAIRHGADGLIAEGCEAGGHVGPLTTAMLIQLLLPVLHRVPVFVAGGIGRGEMIAHYLNLGAAGCQLGTRFVAAHESRVHPRAKAAYLKAAGRDAKLAVQVDPNFQVHPVRAIANAAALDFIAHQHDVIHRHRAGLLSKVEAQSAIEHFWAGRLRRAVIDGDIENGSLMAGQSVEFLRREESVSEIIGTLLAQMAHILAPTRLSRSSWPDRSQEPRRLPANAHRMKEVSAAR
jgi:enoyl-[acyl-carrier protein] reductase II